MTSLPGRNKDAGVNYVQVAAHLDVMHQDGAIAYSPGFDDPPDGAQITDLGPGIMRLRQLAPGNNVSWKVYKLAILSNMANRTWKNPPSCVEERQRIAEDQATTLRCIDFHIRRERYRKRCPAWLTAFEKNSGDGRSLSVSPTTSLPVPPTAASLPVPPTAASLPVPQTASLPVPPTAASLPVPPTAASLPAPPTTAASLPVPPTAARLPVPPTTAASPPSGTSWYTNQQLLDDGWQTFTDDISNVTDDLIYTGSELEFSCDDEGPSQEFAWQPGYETDSWGVRAWRLMVASSGESVGDKEFATSILPPTAGSVLARGRFLDDTELEIPGLVHVDIPKMVKKRGSRAKGKPKQRINGKSTDAVRTKKLAAAEVNKKRQHVLR